MSASPSFRASPPDRKSTLYTDENNLYPITGLEFAKHDTVKYSAKEYARGDVHTNTIENVFSAFKRGMVGVYQHCGEAHLHRYLAEFDFRYNRRAALKVSDAERAEDLPRMARESALPIGGLVEPVTPRQKARKLLHRRKKLRLDSE